MTSTLAVLPGGNLFYDANDRLTSDMYDANGNTISSGGISFAYNFRNQLVQSGGLTATYDGDGNRVNETVGGATTQYLIDTLNPTGLPQVMDELQNGAVTRTYAYGLERISEDQPIGGTWTASFYGYDGHGSTRFLTDAAGSITDTYNYDAFGNDISSTGSTPNEFLFAGEQFDPTLGFYYMRARYYRPATGRFWTLDRVGGVRRSPLSYNPYIYTWDNPVNGLDPTGCSTSTTGERAGPGLEYLVLLTAVALEARPAVRALGQAVACSLELAGTTVAAVVRNPTGILYRESQCVEGSRRDCRRATGWQLERAGIGDPEEFKRDYVGRKAPVSRYDICACSDGSVVIKARGTCGLAGPEIDTGYSWK